MDVLKPAVLTSAECEGSAFSPVGSPSHATLILLWPVSSLSLPQVLLLSFSLILFPSLRPFSDTKVSQGDFGPVRSESPQSPSLTGFL